MNTRGIPRDDPTEDDELLPSTETADITELLRDWSRGQSGALEALMPHVVDELRRVAQSYFARERVDHTLQPTALVNEVYMKLLQRRQVNLQNRAHFFGFVAQLMRRILVDHARGHAAEKRGADAIEVSLDEAFGFSKSRDVDLIALDDALRDLETIDQEGSRIVELRFFAGLTHDEIADLLQIPSIRVRRQWTAARLWLYRELSNR